jgi:VWFA-related protein
MSRRGRRGLPVPALAGVLTALLGLPGLGGRPGAPPAPGLQASKPDQQPPLQNQVTVTLKLIQVFVTDTNGKPALDLQKSDFTLTDNGRQQKITDFEQHVLALPPAGPSAAPAAAAVPATATPLLSRTFFFIIDYVRNELEGIQKAQNAIIEFLETKVRPGDEVALYTLSSLGGLTLHEYLTTDQARLRRTLVKVRGVPGITETHDDSSSAHEPMGMEVMNADIFGRHSGHTGTGSRDHFSEIAAWAKSLRAIPGQKNVILFTRGFGGAVIRPGDSGHSLFLLMTRELASANASVFTVNTTTGVKGKIDQGVFPEMSLDYLSQATGGKYFADVNYYGRIATEIHDATANYYVLGYYIPASWDGKYHQVKVEVRRPGYSVHAQRGYFNPVPFAKLSAVEKHLRLIEAVMGQGADAETSGAFPLEALQFAAGGENTLLLSEIVPDLRDRIGERAEFISLILDANNAIVDGRRSEMEWPGDGTSRIRQFLTAALPPGPYECRAAVRNVDDGRVAVGACAIEVVAPPPGSFLYPPLLLVPGGGSRYVHVSLPRTASGGPSRLSMSEIFPFPSKDYAPLMGPLNKGTDRLYAVLRCVWEKTLRAAGEIELAARLEREAGGELQEIGIEVLDRTSRRETDLYFLGLDLPELEAGRYRLVIDAAEARTGASVRTAVPFEVR